MKKVNLGISGALMLAGMLISDKINVILVYLFASVLHELGHLCAAKALKIKIKQIKLGFSGVRIVVDERLTSYRDEIAISLSGPLVNLLSAFMCFAYCGFAGIEKSELFISAESFMLNGEFETIGALGFFAISSFVQAMTNLLPVRSFDGGRVLECVVSGLKDEGLAERVLNLTTLISAFILWTIALYLMLKLSAGLGIYVFALCIFMLIT